MSQDSPSTGTTGTTFFSRLGKWFKGGGAGGAGATDEDGNLPLEGTVHGPTPGSPGSAIETRSTFLRPWAKRDADITRLREAVTDLMGTFRDHLDQQGRRQDEMIQLLSQLPTALQTLPESNRVQAETLKAIHGQIEYQTNQQHKLAEVLEKLSETGGDQKQMIDALRERVETLNEHDQHIANNLTSVGAAMQGVSKSAETSTQLLTQLKENYTARDAELERILHKQNTRFTTLLAIAIFLAVAALVAVSVMGYLAYEAMQRAR